MLAERPDVETLIPPSSTVLQRSATLLAPSTLVALWARLRARALDEQLAAGADPTSTRSLAARSAQLAAFPLRRRVAAGLERMALSPEQPARRFAVVPRRGAARANRGALLTLAASLRDIAPVYAPGIAAARLIVIDGTGPAYTDARGEGLARQLAHAQSRLSG